MKDTQDKWVCEKYKPLNALLEKAIATHSSTLAWKIPWTEELGGLQSMGSLRVKHDWVTSLSLFTFMHWRRKWQPTRVLAWRIPGTREPGGLPSKGSHRVRHNWSDLAAAAAAECSLPCYSRESINICFIRDYLTLLPSVSSSDTLLSSKPESWKRNRPFLTFQFVFLASLNFFLNHKYL